MLRRVAFSRWCSRLGRSRRKSSGSRVRMNFFEGGCDQLENQFGDLGDVLDELERSSELPNWDEKYEGASQLFNNVITSHNTIRDDYDNKDKRYFDHWYRPRIREMQNWFWMVEVKRAQYLSRNSPGNVSKSEITPTVDSSDLSKLTSSDIYQLWRQKGRPIPKFGEDSQGVPLDLPGYGR